jgi:hypothetical protein
MAGPFESEQATNVEEQFVPSELVGLLGLLSWERLFVC